MEMIEFVPTKKEKIKAFTINRWLEHKSEEAGRLGECAINACLGQVLLENAQLYIRIYEYICTSGGLSFHMLPC